jgi:hypothetical protein
MAKPGPSKGSGGRPRVRNPKPNGEGYIQQTVGPKGKGTRKYEHRVKAGAGPGQVVDHRDAQRGNNDKTNLRLTTRGKNTAMSNRRRSKG